MTTTSVRLGSRLRYPITIVKLLKKPGDRVKKTEPLLEYSFKWMREVGDTIHGDTWLEEQTTLVTWDSPFDGEVTRWLLRKGERVTGDRPAVEVREDCSHGIQFQKLCAICGKDMTEATYATEVRDTARAPISMVHDQTNLTVSTTHAQRTEQELQRRLLRSRKLSLVVDLDQTIIQACIDPTVGEWQRDPTNPNYEAVKDVKSFQLDDGPGDLARRCTYYIKMRPGLEGFLRRISTMYELHVYTMGTRAYAQNVARVVDPDKKLFGNRVISRDENGNIFAKNLQRLFPVSTHMVAIIDDRSDVWPRNRPNLIKVSPYEFFKGIGDINSSFLPKRQDLLTSGVNGIPPKKEKRKPTVVPPTIEALAAAGDDPTITKLQEEEQERAFEKQIHDRPLQALQEQLDREDEEAEKATVISDDSSSDSRSSSPPSQRHRVLQDDDEELVFLEQHLITLHRQFYSEYDANREADNPNAPPDEVDLDAVPDLGEVLSTLKAKVLLGKRIVLSGVLPRGIDIYASEIGLQIMSFGAQLLNKITKDVTHLVVNAAQPGRDKLLAARRRPHIKIVSQEWLAACFSRWEAVDEGPYLFTARLVGEEENPQEVVSDEDEDVENAGASDRGAKTPNGKKPVLKLISANGQATELPADEDDSEDEDEEEDGFPDGDFSPIAALKNFNWASADEELREFLADVSSDSEDDEDDDEDEEDEDDDDNDGNYGHPGDEDDSTSSDSTSHQRRSRGRSRSKTPSLAPGATASALAAQASKKRKAPGDETDDQTVDESSAGDKDDEEQTSSQETPAKRLRRSESQRRESLRSQYVAAAATTESGGSANNGLPTPGGSSDRTESSGQFGDKEDHEMGGDEVGGEEEEEEDFDLAELEAEFEAELSKDQELGEVTMSAAEAGVGDDGEVNLVVEGEKG
ncbi:hypothetical protein VTJ04DRAFT_10805 [Mycothermus thermophilus]|uniref:uncharacterized protein n=1 Tax=Humicola insolens TaxID=85995 RepID=UPI003742ED3A